MPSRVATTQISGVGRVRVMDWVICALFMVAGIGHEMGEGSKGDDLGCGVQGCTHPAGVGVSLDLRGGLLRLGKPCAAK